ncbi:hypothetical protein MPER_13885, partial [Moniliophthora perniciosa FA553]
GRSFDEYDTGADELPSAKPAAGGTILGVAIATSIIFRIVDGVADANPEAGDSTYYGKNGVACVLRFSGLCTLVR